MLLVVLAVFLRYSSLFSCCISYEYTKWSPTIFFVFFREGRPSIGRRPTYALKKKKARAIFMPIPPLFVGTAAVAYEPSAESRGWCMDLLADRL